ncbi:hypothetical protein F7642_01345 [Tenacibaculum finnmarkense genomovar ulcerans]|uniref:hypothetical protein n=1 Tax=Tenacibaculum finnmarkense TaxID=2781243 RepID=UPI000739191B|nr:hypothetical protein [Tenacibaculum finnmarkense]ALU75569.1 hypothetical protein AUW17_10010 [Tenacibaculum dicentrarchi]MBE7632981.1 hypothetical protein [Tenacibaculum finnmarkense genomovar ulcerans]MCD8428899.1 hypothetical protein [Tenacibaculum finnmarkense genomovar ulcerans]
MPLNLIKKYPNLLEIMHLNEYDRLQSLRPIFNRDIQDNEKLAFQTKIIRPIKKDGEATFETVFNHLIKENVLVVDQATGKKIKRRVFEKDRAQRLHWVKFHLELKKTANVEVFSTKERDNRKRKDVFRTYIYDTEQQYIVVLEPQNSGLDYYLLSAYHLNEDWAPKNMRKKMKKKLPTIL